MDRFLFPRWVNRFLLLLGAVIGIGAVYAGALGGLITDPVTLNIGYQPDQPVPFSHALHAGELRMDCRYCHNTVFDAAHAAIPPTATCINCHSPADETGQAALASVHAESEKLRPIHESWRTGQSMEWTRVHNLPQFVFFNHAAHVNSGVSCVTCHGRIDQMEVVQQERELSMAWCIECHRDPTPHLRPKEFVTDLAWERDETIHPSGEELQKEHHINPQVNCAVCHR